MPGAAITDSRIVDCMLLYGSDPCLTSSTQHVKPLALIVPHRYDAVTEAMLNTHAPTPNGAAAQPAPCQQASEQCTWAHQLPPAAASRLVWAYGAGAGVVAWRRGELQAALTRMVRGCAFDLLHVPAS